MSYYSNTNLMNSPHAPRMGATQRHTFMAGLAKARAATAKARQEKEATMTTQELYDVGTALGFSCHAPFEDPLSCMDGPCEACPFWQYDPSPPPPAYQRDEEMSPAVMEYMTRTMEDEKARLEAEAAYVTEYNAWEMEMAQIGLRKARAALIRW